MKEHFTLAVRDADTSERDMWILDSWSRRHLISDESLLEDTRDCESEWVLPDGDMLKLTKMRSVLSTVEAGESSTRYELLRFFWPHPSLVTLCRMVCLRRKVTR